MKTFIALAFSCLLATAVSAQTVTTTETAPLTPYQLEQAQQETRRRLALLSYRLDYRIETLDEKGNVTGSKSAAWRVLRLKGDVQIERVSASRSTLKGIRMPERELAFQSRYLPDFFSQTCPLRLVRTEGSRLLYRTWYGGFGSCFDGTVWVSEAGLALEAEGRFEPSRWKDKNGQEYVAPRARYVMNGEGLPVEISGEDILTYSRLDKNGQPLRVRVRHSARFSEYRRARTGEPVIVEQGDVEP